jgi:hypothetical protein
MPHVASQIFGERPSDEFQTSKQAMNTSAEFQRPTTAMQPRKRPLENGLPSLSLLVTSPDNPHWDFGSIRHIRKASENATPISAVESVFELPSAGSCKATPNSSTNSLFVAELEDTSPHTLKTRHTSSELPPKSPANSVKSSTSSSNLHPKSATTPIPGSSALPQLEPPQSPTRSVRSVKSQTYLHPKSPAAITSAELYFDQPNSLSPSVRSSRSPTHLRSHSTIPITSPKPYEQPLPPLPSKLSPHLNPPANIKSRAAAVIETMTAIENDNRQLLERAVAAEKKARVLQEMNLTLQNRVANCVQHHPPKTAPTRSRRTASEGTPVWTFNTAPIRHRPTPLNITPEIKSISRDYDLAARGSPPRPIRQAHAPTYLEASSISGPIPGSVVRQQITYNGTPISSAPPVATISLVEARRREKPLPYIVPLSPSAVPAFVEMGSKVEICAAERELRKKKTFGDLFRCGKRQGGVRV